MYQPLVWSSRPKSELDRHKFKIFLTLWHKSAHRNSNPDECCIYVMFLMICVTPANSQSYTITISAKKSAAAHLDVFLELLYLSGQCPAHTQLKVHLHVTHAAGNLCCIILPTSAYGWPIVLDLSVKTPIMCYGNQTVLHIWVCVDTVAKSWVLYYNTVFDFQTY